MLTLLGEMHAKDWLPWGSSSHAVTCHVKSLVSLIGSCPQGGRHVDSSFSVMLHAENNQVKENTTTQKEAMLPADPREG